LEFYFSRLKALLAVSSLTGTLGAVLMFIIEVLPRTVLLLIVVCVLAIVAVVLIVFALVARTVISVQLEPLLGEVQ